MLIKQSRFKSFKPFNRFAPFKTFQANIRSKSSSCSNRSPPSGKIKNWRHNAILRKFSEGATEDNLLDAYPRLSRQDIQAAIGYAADTLAHEEILIVTPRKTRIHR